MGHFPCSFDLVNPTISTSPPMKHIQHDDLDPFSPNLQHVGGVLSCLTRGTNLNIQYFAQLSRKYDRLRYV
jgi:hypothetical protein